MRHVRRALADPGSEQAKDIWDLAVFGHPGRLAFTGITQAWLRQAAKHWAAEDLPRHRGNGATNVRAKVNALTRLSESLRCRPDHGDLPAALGRADIENFLNRLGYLESAGTISRYHRNVICRGARTILTGIRALGLTRPGQAAAGLPGDFAIGIGDIPAEPERGEPGRDLPPEIMTVLCASLDTLQPARGPGRHPDRHRHRPAARRDPRPGTGLPGPRQRRRAVLVYDNTKAGRLGRRLPISQATATVITAQQDRVRARFPAHPGQRAEAAARRAAQPRRPQTHHHRHAGGRHRDWVDALRAAAHPRRRRVRQRQDHPYAYRHTYAQRHADAGVPIDVLRRAA